jgi:dTDP-4-dehydrorhamnose reductase
MVSFDRIIITGGGGMLAGALQRALLQQGQQAYCLPRAALDIADPDSVAAAFDQYRPSLVLNCAAYTKVDMAEKESATADQINGHSVGRLARLCRDRGAALVHFSTDYVFDGSQNHPLKETDPVGPRSAYGRSKLLGEQLLEEQAPDHWMILRTAWLYGPGGPNFAATMINAATAGRPLSVVADQHGAPTFTEDLSAACVQLLQKDAANGIYHVTNGGQTTWFDFTAAILERFHLSAPLSPTTTDEWRQKKPDSAPRPQFSVLDLSKTEKTLGRSMPDWRQGLERYHSAMSEPQKR